MSEPFLGQISIVGFNFAPKGWQFCNGQLLSIQQNQALFSLLGTTYGGNGQTTFALPNFQGRAPIHVGNGFTEGQVGGEQTHSLIVTEMPAHSHAATATLDQATSASPAGNLLSSKGRRGKNVYGSVPANGEAVTLDPRAISSIGGQQAHDNMQPYLVVNFIIALQGIFPSRN